MTGAQPNGVQETRLCGPAVTRKRLAPCVLGGSIDSSETPRPSICDTLRSPPPFASRPRPELSGGINGGSRRSNSEQTTIEGLHLASQLPPRVYLHRRCRGPFGLSLSPFYLKPRRFPHFRRSQNSPRSESSSRASGTSDRNVPHFYQWGTTTPSSECGRLLRSGSRDSVCLMIGNPPGPKPVYRQDDWPTRGQVMRAHYQHFISGQSAMPGIRPFVASVNKEPGKFIGICESLTLSSTQELAPQANYYRAVPSDWFFQGA
ncbi:hypothetical protein FHG87_010860 [Trinorchestia longiramus]|nr:hypothetical protein FHG87_010860 [Trinorchestia longiramus]